MSIQMNQVALTDPKLLAELDHLAARQLAGRGPLLRGVEAVGRLTEGAATTLLGLSPVALESILTSAFQQLYDLSAQGDNINLIRNAPMAANRTAAVLSGATGGWFGLIGIVPDLIASTTVIFNAIQKVARKHGFDTTDPMIRLECLSVFQYGEPGRDGDAAAQSFLANRVLTNGQTVSTLISRFAGKFASRLSAKLGAQAVPVLGAASGAAINYAFLGYYERVADIHFRLLRLEQDHPEYDIQSAYALALSRIKQPRLARRQKGTSSAPPPTG